MSDKAKTRVPRIAYIMSRFPSIWETFIFREVLEMKKTGMRICLFSLKNIGDGLKHRDAADLIAQTHYSPYLSLRVIRAQLYFLRTAPLCYLKTIFLVLGQVHASLDLFVKTLCLLPKSIYFARIIKEGRIEHIHAHWASLPTICALAISRLSGIPYSCTAHAGDIYEYNAGLESRLNSAKFIVTCTQDNVDYLTNNIPSLRGKLYLSYHGIDLKKFSPNKKNKNGSSRMRLLSVGRIDGRKGYKYLVEACAILREQGFDFECAIIGDGTNKKELEGLLNKLNLAGQVTLLGKQAQEVVLEHYKQAELFILPALAERHWGIPNVIVEAMAMEIPVIVTPLPALLDVIADNESGIFIPEKDSSAIAEAVKRLADNEKLRLALGKRGREKIKALFDIRKNTRELAQIFANNLSPWGGTGEHEI